MMTESNPLPARHLSYPCRRRAALPPCVRPSAVKPHRLLPVAGVGGDHVRIVPPRASAYDVGIFVKSRLKPRERHGLVGIDSEPVPGILKRRIVTREIKPLAAVEKRETVCYRKARILVIKLPELPGAPEIRRRVAIAGDFRDRILEALASEKSRQELGVLRQPAVADERIMKFADARMRLAVGDFRREAHKPFRFECHRKRERRVEFSAAADERRIFENDRVFTGGYPRCLFRAENRHFTFLVGAALVVEVQPPERSSARPVMPRSLADERLELALFTDLDADLAVFQYGRGCADGGKGAKQQYCFLEFHNFYYNILPAKVVQLNESNRKLIQKGLLLLIHMCFAL